MLSREIERRSVRTWASHGWYGNRSVAVMLEILHGRGLVAVVGRAERPAALGSRGALVSRGREGPAARGRAAARRAALPRARRAADHEGLGGAPRRDRRPGSRSRHVPLPLRPPHPRPRPRRGALRLPLPPRDVRAEGEARVRLLRAPILVGDRSSAASSRASTARRGRSRCSAPGATRPARTRRSTSLATFLGAERTTPHLGSRDAVRDAGDPRRPGARPRHRRDHDADLPDLDVRAGGGRRPQGLRLRTRREPDAHGAPGVHRLARGRRARPRVLVRARRARRRSCTCSRRATTSSP